MPGSEPWWQRWPWGLPWKRRGWQCVRAVSHQYQLPGTASGSALAAWFTQALLPLMPPVPSHVIPLALIKPLISRLEIRLRNATLEQAGVLQLGSQR